jgi:nicotinate-nucleotide adenylyltransferase
LASRLGVLGGTFDPVHIGHLILGETAREQARLERVLFVPAGQQWRKAERETAPAEHRVAMVRLAIEGHPQFELSLLEVQRPGPSYTEVTLEALRAGNAEQELFFIIGRDALADLPNWRAPARILELAALLVAERPGEGGGAAEEAVLPGLKARLEWLRMPLIEVSASDIRRRVYEGRSIRYLTPDPVVRYIAEKGLYR